MPDPIRVLVVDDSAFMRSALKRSIEADPRFKVIDTASDGKQAVEKALRLKPDVVTLDVEMPIMNGIDALKAIVARSTIPVIMVSAVTDAGAKITMDALDLGAVDFIPKAKGAELIHEKLLAAISANPARRGFALRLQERMKAQGKPLVSGQPKPEELAKPSAKAPPGDKQAPLARPAVKAPSVLRPQTTTQFQGQPGAAAKREVSYIRVPAKIVVIGSSTGGPQALQEVLSQIPANLPVPVVVAQHMPPQFTMALAKRLDEVCPPKVVEARDGETLVRGTVYIGPGGMHLRVTQSELKVDESKGESLYKPSVDVLAQSALAAFGKNVLCIMLTGMGNDGAAEFIKLHQAGAYTVVQDQNTCVVYGMPRAVADAGAADEILPVERIGMRIRSAFGL
jgi:two-component system, chemotaxis family, protein-glutamate methylesterase/glutaminase